MFKRFTRPVPLHNLPRLTIAQRVIDKIVQNALLYETETGESLVGFAIPSPGRSEPDLYVLDTIAPDTDAIRQYALFEQGDDWQEEIFNWLYRNWEKMRERMRTVTSDNSAPKWDVPLMHLGDWHKHPGSLVEPSWGDTITAREFILDRDNDYSQVLVVLATVWEKFLLGEETSERAADDGVLMTEEDDEIPEDERPETGDTQPLKIPVDDRYLVRVDFWYLSRGIRRFNRLQPVVVPDGDLPALPLLGWHLSQPERLRAEIDLLSREGYSWSVRRFDADRVPPLEICLSLAKRSSQYVIIVITEADYPKIMPRVRLTPMNALKDIPEDADIFSRLWEASQPLVQAAYPTWEWNENRRLIDLVREVEARAAEGNAV